MHKDGKQSTVDYISMEYVEGRSLEEYLYQARKYKIPFEEHTCREYFRQLLMALHHMHSTGVCHRDLKPDNIIISPDGKLKIIDLGFAMDILGNNKDGYLHTYLGTPGYMAPEILTMNY